MNFKIDTKEKFTIITPLSSNLYDNLTEELTQEVNRCMHSDPRNVVLNMKNVEFIDEAAATKLASLQQLFHENNTSFVICEIQAAVTTKLEELELSDYINITPTESEAWDIVQMEEIERELLGDDENSF